MPKRLIKLNDRTFLDRLNFTRILIIWISTIFVFGGIYFFLSGADGALLYSRDLSRVTSLTDSVYFSFVTATTTGFGDIVPFGMFKLVAVLQVISGLLLLALVTSRLVSIKQDAILTELYEISFKEKIDRLRSSLLLFRQSLERLTSSLDEKTFKQKDLKNINSSLTSFDYVLGEIKLAIDSNKNNRFTKDLDPVSTEILFNSTLNSFDKICELIDLLEQNKVEWKKEVSIGLLSKCLKANEEIFGNLPSSGLGKATMNDLEVRKEDTKHRLKARMFD